VVVTSLLSTYESTNYCPSPPIRKIAAYFNDMIELMLDIENFRTITTDRVARLKRFEVIIKRYGRRLDFPTLGNFRALSDTRNSFHDPEVDIFDAVYNDALVLMQGKLG
jgi:hypothetical protein